MAIWFLPILGAFIGWVTNYLAILLLFRPKKRIRLPLIGYTLQGLLPRYRDELARSVGETLERELFSLEDIFEGLYRKDSKEEVLRVILAAVSQRIEEKLPRFIPDNLRTTLKDYVNSFLSTQILSLFDETLLKLEEYLKEKVSIEEIVEEKLKRLDMDKLEALVRKVASRELKHIEILGGILGFLIGLVQMALASFVMP